MHQSAGQMKAGEQGPMGLHVEWMDADLVRPETLVEDTVIGEHAVTQPLGLALGCLGDCSVVVIEGSRAALIRVLDAARASLDSPSSD